MMILKFSMDQMYKSNSNLDQIPNFNPGLPNQNHHQLTHLLTHTLILMMAVCTTKKKFQIILLTPVMIY